MDLTVTSPPIDSASPDGLKPTNVTGHITVKNVSFHYPSCPEIPILKNLSLTFKPNTTTALVSTSGSRKSTIVSLVEWFYDPDWEDWQVHHSNSDDFNSEKLGDGVVVKLDGVDLQELNLIHGRATLIGQMLSQELDAIHIHFLDLTPLLPIPHSFLPHPY